MKVYKQFLASYLCVCLVPLLLSHSRVLLLCSDLATLQSTESTSMSIDFQGVGWPSELRNNHPQRRWGFAGEVPHYLSLGSGWARGA